MSANKISGGGERLDWRGIARAAGIGALSVLGAVMLYNILAIFVDNVLNGVFIDWVANAFLNMHNLNEFGIPAGVALDIVGTRYFFFQLGICAAAAIAVVAVVASVLAGKRARREERAQAAELLRLYLGHDLEAHEAFPPGWEELALVASDAKQAAAVKERQLADEAARKNDLITYLAHDLKTPLTSVIGYLSLLDEIPEMPQEQRCRYVGITLDKAKRLERLINEFFDITRYNLQHIELELESVDLSFMLVQMAEEFRPMLDAHGNTIELEICGVHVASEADAPELTLMADPDRLARVLNNVLKNAVAYSSAGSAIGVSAQVTGEGEQRRAQILVTDTGVTIPPHKLEAIFDKFFRLDEARATSTGGAGLGLAIAREIVELHGGTITAASEAGVTTFTIELPMLGKA